MMIRPSIFNKTGAQELGKFCNVAQANFTGLEVSSKVDNEIRRCCTFSTSVITIWLILARNPYSSGYVGGGKGGGSPPYLELLI